MEYTERLQIFAQVYQRQIILDTPAVCATLIERARQAGIAVRHLYVLSEPLFPYRSGGCDLVHRDIWILFRCDEEDGQTHLVRSLLHDLAHLAGTTSGAYATIDEDWDEEMRTWERAYQLAECWGMESCFPKAALQEELDLIEQLREAHWEAGSLAGSLRPGIARAAYDAICQFAGQRGWTRQQLSDALLGQSTDSAACEVVDFDRCLLRWSWNLPYGYGTGDFVPSSLPQHAASAELLARAMTAISQRERPFAFSHWMSIHDGKTSLGFLQIEDTQTLLEGLALVNHLMLDHEDLSARASWWAYSASTAPLLPHLYRLSVSYHSAWQQRQHSEQQELPEKELWILFPPRRAHGEALIEATWQRYILSWRRSIGLRSLPLEDGLTLVWHYFARAHERKPA